MTQGATILIVEDDLDTQMALTDLLHHEGYRTAVFGSWSFDSVGEQRCGAVIFDIPLYRPKAMSLLSRLADLRPCVPVILLMGHDSDGALLASHKITVFTKLRKPYSADDIKSHVQAAIAGAVMVRCRVQKAGD